MQCGQLMFRFWVPCEVVTSIKLTHMSVTCLSGCGKHLRSMPLVEFKYTGHHYWYCHHAMWGHQSSASYHWKSLHSGQLLPIIPSPSHRTTLLYCDGFRFTCKVVRLLSFCVWLISLVFSQWQSFLLFQVFRGFIDYSSVVSSLTLMSLIHLK